MSIVAALGCLVLTGCPGAGDVTGTGKNVGVVPRLNGGCQIPANADAMVQKVLELVNQERTHRGLNAVTLNPQLTRLAEDYACQMIDQGFFDHFTPGPEPLGPGERAIDAGYIFLALCENLAAGQTSPEQVMTEWMASESHRQNILGPQWREVGIAVRAGGEHGVYWVQEFGNPP